MKRKLSSKMLCNVFMASAAALALLSVSGTLCAKLKPLNAMPEQQTSPSVYPNAFSTHSSPDNPSSTPDYQVRRPQPLMHGEDFNYDLYYNYRLTPHIILRPNLQQMTKPGAVEDNSQRFVGGLSAGIKF